MPSAARDTDSYPAQRLAEASLARPVGVEPTTYGFEAGSEPSDSAELCGVASNERQLAVTLARALLGKIAAGEPIGIDALEALAFAVLDSNEITRLAMRVADDREAHRLTRAIELAAMLIERETATRANEAPCRNEPDTLARR